MRPDVHDERDDDLPEIEGDQARDRSDRPSPAGGVDRREREERASLRARAPVPEASHRNRDAMWERIAWGTSAFVLVASVMCVGAVDTVVLVPIALVAIVSALASAPLAASSLGSPEDGVAARRSERSSESRSSSAPPSPRQMVHRTWPAPALVALALALYTAIQAMPMPLSWLSVIAPANADVWARSLSPLGEQPTWGTISLDPGASWVEALKWLSYSCVIFSMTVLARRRGGAWGLAMVLGSATLVSIVTVLHGILDAKKVFGIYATATPFATNHMGPLLNTNNLAGYLNLGTLSGIGLLVMRRPIVRPWITGLCVAVNVAATVRSASRGGVAALAIGMLVLAILVHHRNAERTSLRARLAPWILGGGTVAFGVALAILGGDRLVWSELWNDNLAKLKIVAWTGPMLKTYPLFGVGRGAFESVFEAFRPATGVHVVYTHPENFPAQWIAEWGWPVGAIAMLSLAYLYRPWVLGVQRSVVVAAGWCAVMTLLLQNLVDLGLEIPALSFAAAATLGALWGDQRRRRSRAAQTVERWFVAAGPRRTAIVVAVAGAVLASLALRLGMSDVATDRADIRKMYERASAGGSPEKAAFREALRAVMLRRPAEYYFPLIGASAAHRWKDEKPMPWLNHALERGPMNGRVHLLIADVVAANGARLQALMELRIAMECDQFLTETAMPLATSLARSPEDLMRAVPEGKPGALVLSTMARWLVKPEQIGLRRQVDRAALERDPALVEPRRRLTGSLVAAIEAHVAGRGTDEVCPSIPECIDDVDGHARAVAEVLTTSSIPVQMRAAAQIAAGDRKRAEELLAEGCGAPDDRNECIRIRIENLLALGDAAKLEQALKEYLSSQCVNAKTCAEAATYVGEVRLHRGDQRGAVTAFQRAAIEDPTEDRWLRVADTAERAKMFSQAVEALKRVAERRPGDPDLAARLQRARRSASQLLLP